MNWVNHTTECTFDAPNENIESHYYQVEMDKKQKEWDKQWGKIIDRMDEMELWEWAHFLAAGIPMGQNTLCYGSEMMKKLNDFQDKMKAKYL
jgi:hypothetical protein